jgi:hypothetical protein
VISIGQNFNSENPLTAEKNATATGAFVAFGNGTTYKGENIRGNTKRSAYIISAKIVRDEPFNADSSKPARFLIISLAPSYLLGETYDF